MFAVQLDGSGDGLWIPPRGRFENVSFLNQSATSSVRIQLRPGEPFIVLNANTALELEESESHMIRDQVSFDAGPANGTVLVSWEKV